MPGKVNPCAGDEVAQLEDRQKHADHDAAYHHAQEDDQQRLDQRGQADERVLDFFVQKIRHALQHGVNFAGLFAGCHHADDHGRENGVLGQRGGNAFAALDVGRGGLDGVFHHDVADGVLDNGQHFQNGHAAADERRHACG